MRVSSACVAALIVFGFCSVPHIAGNKVPGAPHGNIRLAKTRGSEAAKTVEQLAKEEEDGPAVTGGALSPVVSASAGEAGEWEWDDFSEPGPDGEYPVPMPLLKGGNDRMYYENDDGERHNSAKLPRCPGLKQKECDQRKPACAFDLQAKECRWRDCGELEPADCDLQYGCFFDGGVDKCRQLQCRDVFEEDKCDATEGCKWLSRKCRQTFDRVPRHVLIPVDDPAEGEEQPVDEKRPLPNPHPGLFAYDEAAAFRYSRYAAAMYCEEEAVRNLTCPMCTKSEILRRVQHPQIVLEKNIHLFAFLGFDPVSKEIFVSYRGTEMTSLKQWAMDIYLVKTELTKIEPVLFTSSLRFQFDDLETALLHRAKVHEGFKTGYQGMRDEVFSALASLVKQHPDFKRVVFTGHSLGGGLAVLTAIEAAFRFPQRELRDHLRVYTYGAPRVGNPAFAMLFNRLIPDTWQIANGAEFAPRVPTRSMGFWHVGNMAWYVNNQRVICTNPEARKCFSSLNFWSLTWIEHTFMYLEQPVGGYLCLATDDKYKPKTHDLAEPGWEARAIAMEEGLEYYKNIPLAKPLKSFSDARLMGWADWMGKILPPNRGLEQLVDNITPTHTQQDFSID